MLCRRSTQDPRICVVTMEQDLNEKNVPGLMNEITFQCGEGVQAFVIDCSRLRFISSYGVSVLLRIRKYTRECTGLSLEPVALAGAPSTVMDVLNMARLGTVFPARDDVASSVSGIVERLSRPD